MAPKPLYIKGPVGPLETFLSVPSGGSENAPLLLLCHGLPLNREGSRTAALQLPELGERLAAESGWAVGVASLRGVGQSPGTFSASGWKEDLSCVIASLRDGRHPIVLAGFGIGGALALRVASESDDVRGVAIFATPSNLSGWCGSEEEFAQSCERAGVIGSEALLGPKELLADVLALDPRGAAEGIPPKRMMIVHGSNDAIVPVSAARELLEAADGHGELRIIQGAGHWLRADPRMFATLLGWLDRQL